MDFYPGGHPGSKEVGRAPCFIVNDLQDYTWTFSSNNLLRGEIMYNKVRGPWKMKRQF